ncbi:peroxidase [Marchantia polymorpha subsp. ruderalis]|uniref:Peroxidase n=1 Tax=Marchantia polymorpha TaxID=3197 RepID=A0A2R6XN79_MARPO|nr:hypothetical protein MARPO_0008s0232 [Marchantia polymorpha]BBN19347.1 hypothetical protein Mp_8g09900 [Marchantia polymorpha subsp. ruderalis]|eukprot:PTQ47486.1 hypothetical protein MARPO_0008s0232 [Marchantia polymorpha]
MVISGGRTSISFAAVISCLLVAQASGLYVGFYAASCPNAESIILETLKPFLASDPTLGGPLLRISYHDCFVRGCDASLLLDSVNGNVAEKDAPGPNLNSVRGYEVYDGIKAALESSCPGVVSCADIVQIVSRDVTVLDGGPYWDVQTGRRDGLISIAAEAQANLVGPDSDYDTQKNAFANKGLSEKDLVVLTGAHTIGRSRCVSIEQRLYNFSGVQGQTDPSLDVSFARELKATCPSGSSNSLEMDGTQFKFDTRYFKRLQVHKGLFGSDASLITQPFPASVVEEETHKDSFYADFPESMLRLAALDVLTGSDGEIRKNCAFVNS